MGSGGMRNVRRHELRTLLLGASLPIMIALSIMAWIHRHDGRALAELDSLLAKGEAEHETCRRFLDQWDQLTKKVGDVDHGKAHPSKADALEILALLEKYPGREPSYTAAADFYEDHATDLARNALQPLLIRRKGELYGECSLIGFYRHAQMLLEDLRRYNFTAPEKARALSVVAGYLTRESRFHGFLEAGVKAYLLAGYLEVARGNSKELDDARALVKEFDARDFELREISAGEPRFWRTLTLQSDAFEHKQTRELYRVYYRIVREAKL